MCKSPTVQIRSQTHPQEKHISGYMVIKVGSEKDELTRSTWKHAGCMEYLAMGMIGVHIFQTYPVRNLNAYH